MGSSTKPPSNSFSSASRLLLRSRHMPIDMALDVSRQWTMYPVLPPMASQIGLLDVPARERYLSHILILILLARSACKSESLALYTSMSVTSYVSEFSSIISSASSFEGKPILEARYASPIESQSFLWYLSTSYIESTNETPFGSLQ